MSTPRISVSLSPELRQELRNYALKSHDSNMSAAAASLLNLAFWYLSGDRKLRIFKPLLRGNPNLQLNPPQIKPGLRADWAKNRGLGCRCDLPGAEGAQANACKPAVTA